MMTIVAIVLLLVLMVAALVAMMVGMFVAGREAVLQLRQTSPRPGECADPELEVSLQAQLDDLALRRGLEAPRVSVVPVLGKRTPDGDCDAIGSGGLAAIRIRRRRTPTVAVAVAAKHLSMSARESLLAHELGHFERNIRLRSVRWTRYLWALTMAAIVIAVLWLAYVSSPGTAVGVGGILGLIWLAASSAVSRREETLVDLYAIDLSGDISAAAELMAVYTHSRGRRGRVWRAMEERAFASHPTPEVRLAAMRERFSAAQTSGTARAD